ncbi:MAG: DUF58 domain-containing protein, partial [Gemmatirosa sp.]
SLAEPGAGKESKAGVGLAQASRLVRRAGMVMLISDLLVDAPEVEEALRGLRAAGHDVTVLHVMDPAERDLSLLAGEAVFEDPESGLAVPAVAGEVREAYRATVDAAIEGWRSTCSRLGARYVQISTDAPFGVPLRHAFTARSRVP